jgi:hypothetical protein
MNNHEKEQQTNMDPLNDASERLNITEGTLKSVVDGLAGYYYEQNTMLLSSVEVEREKIEENKAKIRALEDVLTFAGRKDLLQAIQKFTTEDYSIRKRPFGNK